MAAKHVLRLGLKWKRGADDFFS